MDHWDQLFEELVQLQRKKLLAFAKTLYPQITEEDLLQPFDFPLLEEHPYFRYEEGVVEGLLTAQAAILAKISEI